MIMIAAPGKKSRHKVSLYFYFAMTGKDTLVDADHEPDEERLVRKCSSLRRLTGQQQQK
jgi:hypothetical protein